jgi:mono/diheme cytochrome c family protein
MSASANAANTVSETDIFQSFTAICHQCHMAPVPGFTFPATVADFGPTVMSDGIIQHVTGAVCPNPAEPGSPNDPMPPCSSPNGGTYAKRPATDPVWQLGQLLTEWAAAGYAGQFTPSSGDGGASDAGASDGGDAGTASPYALTPAIGNAMTNLGNCIPVALASVEDPKAAALDKMFAGLVANPNGTTGAAQIGLPASLSETDLFTLDSAQLALYGVVAYAPAYPLWSDNAGKLRYVRVPHGTSIHFDKATQKFQIPPNTRFYKTFMKRIADTDGSYRYRKIETRLIVSRPDSNDASGAAKSVGGQTALFGTYQWTADEKDAILITTPLNSGEPFGDTLLTYNTDEQLAADIERGVPAGVDPTSALLSAEPPAARHYAIPSSQRCMQCHMGSPSEAFVLGFTPLQINRRPTGTSGIIDDSVGEAEDAPSPAGPDELTQLQRLIDYGVITGIDSPSDVLLLEDSQGTRTPRNNYELVAQGYMLGNCAHCHNPRGFPSVQNPGLSTILDFLPGPTGGIFQFPLESYSPYIGRGLTGTTQIPFITPSLVDLPRVDTTAGGSGTVGQSAPDIFVFGSAQSPAPPPEWVIYAPWRSIIYRNVDAAFTYEDDVAIFPHMPFNTPGYDPRAKQILGDWMVSIPAVRKHPELVEYAYQTDYGAPDENIGSPIVDTSTQPYAEVSPGSPGYAAAVAAATERLAIFHTGVNPAVPIDLVNGFVYSRYADPGETLDIVDPSVTSCNPVPVGWEGADVPQSRANFYPFPNHPHWVITDTSLPPPPWEPRQTSWPQALVEQIPSASQGNPCINSQNDPVQYQANMQAAADEARAVAVLQTTTLEQVGTDQKGFATIPLPFGLWQVQKNCTYPTSGPSAVKQVGSFTGASGFVQANPGAPLPHWMQVATPPLPATAAVYMETPGAAIFKMICINCHGPDANSQGRLAANLATMTGGQAQVADFRDGLFGPVTAPDTNIQRVFGTSAINAIYASFPADAGASAESTAESDWTPLTPDDRAGRYMPWMALGGTSVQIPQEILEIVAVTQVLGVQRVLPSTSLSANMLSEAKTLCLSLLGAPYQGVNSFTPAGTFPGAGYLDRAINSKLAGGPLNSNLIYQNGDAELWLRLCAITAASSTNGPPPYAPPIHVLRPQSVINNAIAIATEFDPAGTLMFNTTSTSDSSPPGTPKLVTVGGGSAYALVGPEQWPAGAPVGNDRGGLDTGGLVYPDATNVLPGATTPGNLWPWCIDPTPPQPGGRPPLDITTSLATAGLTSYICPAQVLQVSRNCDAFPAIQPATGSCFGNDRANEWAVHGAINAGMSVFLYVQSLETLAAPPPDYNECPTAVSAAP